MARRCRLPKGTFERPEQVIGKTVFDADRRRGAGLRHAPGFREIGRRIGCAGRDARGFDSCDGFERA